MDGKLDMKMIRPQKPNFLVIGFSRSKCSQMFFKIGALKNISNIHRKTPVLVPFFNKVAGLKARSFIKKRLNVGVLQ